MLSNLTNYITELQATKCSIWVRRLISPGSSNTRWREKRSSNGQFEHVSHVPSANCPREEFLPFCYLVESWGCLSPQQTALWAAQRQARNEPFARAGVASDGGFEGASGVQCSPSFLRKLVRRGAQNFSMPNKCFGLLGKHILCWNPSTNHPVSQFLGQLEKLACSAGMDADEIVQEQLLTIQEK